MQLPIRRREIKSQPRSDIEERVSSLRESIGKFLDELSWAPWERRILPFENGWAPRVDISESNTEMTIELDIPGVDPVKVSIEMDDRSLSVCGKTEKEREEKGKTWYRMEREMGEFRRVFELPANVDAERIKAHFKNGVLAIDIPKKEGAPKKKIAVEHEL